MTISFLLQKHGKTLLHQRCSQSKKKASLGRYFTRYLFLKVHRKTPVFKSLINKVAGMSPSEVFSYEVFFLITPQNQTTFQRK